MSSIYQNLYDAYKKCYCENLSKEKIQLNVNDLWKSLKGDKTSYPNNVHRTIKYLLEEKSRKDAVRLSFFTRKVS